MFSSFNARAVGLPDLPVEATIDLAAAAGFAAVDLMVRDIVRSGTDLSAVRTRLDERGLRAGAFPMTMDWRGDAVNFQRDLAELPRLAAAAAALGLTRTGTWVMPETPGFPAAETDRATHRGHVAAFHIERIGAIERILADHGIRLGLEVIGVASFRRGLGVPFITRMADLEPSLSPLFERPGVGLLVDAFHLYAADEPFAAALAWGPKRIVWAHVANLPPGWIGDRAAINDPERGLPDSGGPIDCRAFLSLLKNAGYDGPVTVEPLARCAALVGQPQDQVAGRVKAALDSCWP